MATAIASPVRTPSVRRRSPLTQWHLLSLDAPCVAALWTLFFARSFGVHLPATAPVALAIAVWMLYVADRVSDAAMGEALEERHRFHQQHRTIFFLAWLLCVPVLIALVASLPHGIREAWLGLALPLGVYVGLIHGLKLTRVPKEPLVGIFFACATILPVLVSGGPFRTCAAAALLFGAVCWMNCVAIARWENIPAEAMDYWSQWIAKHFHTCAFALLLLSLLFLWQKSAAVALAIAVSAALLLLLDEQQVHLDELNLRALADAALLTPILIWPLFALFLWQ